MAENKKYEVSFSKQSLENELQREKNKNAFWRTLRNTVYILIVIAAVATLIAVLVLPVLQITGESMKNTIQNGDICVAFRGGGYEKGDVIAFYYSNDILVKRVLAVSGEWVDIDENGNVYVNGEIIDEPYAINKSLGDNCNIKFPYQIPDGKVFILGDNRSVSLDSRSTAIGCVADEQIIGKVLIRVWPIKDFGTFK